MSSSIEELNEEIESSQLDQVQLLNLDKTLLRLNQSLNEFLNLATDYVFDGIDLINQWNIPETYIIGFILAIISLILWCLLSCKKSNQLPEPLPSGKQNQQAQVESKSSQKNAANKQQPQQKHNMSNDDGYLSDSALSFFSRLGQQGPRFRKRDKLFFYGKKMLRTVSTVKGSISAQSAEKSKNFYKILAKKLLNFKNDDSIPPLYRRTEPPQSLLDIESSNEKNDHNLPSALINLIRSVKVFGYLDQKIILEMCKYMETKTIYANNYLFKIGDPDDSIYVVESGLVHVFITDEKGRKHLIKECGEGNHIFSLLSIMDVLTGDTKPYKTVSAKAVQDTSILRLPGKAFVDVLHRYPDYLVRITQIIIVRLQRVTFLALHNYLGLTSEMIRKSDIKKLKKLKSKRYELDAIINSTENSSVSSRALDSVNNLHLGSMVSSTAAGTAPATAVSTGSAHHQPHYHHHHHVRHHHHHHHHHYRPDVFSTTTDEADDSDTMKLNAKTVVSPSGQPIQEELVDSMRSNQNNSCADLQADTLDQLNTSNSQMTNSALTFDQKASSSDDDTMETASTMSSCEGSEFGDGFNSTDLQKKLPQVQKDMCDMLKLSDVKILTDRVNLMHVSEGTVLCKEGDFNCSLMFVLDGLLMATQKELNGEEATIYYCQPNHFCVNLSVISGEPSLFTIVAKTDSQIAVINKANFHKIITAQPMVVLSLAHFIVKQMSPFVRQIDFALEWNLIESGSALFRQAVKAENIYIVLNGRLRSILKTNETNKQLVGEFGRGDLVGLVEILMETNNATTVVAIRDTEVAQIPCGLLNYIKYRHPRVVTRLIQMLSSKLLGTIQKEPTTPYLDSYYGLRQPIDAPTLVSNLCTVAIMPVSDDVPLHAFTMHLCHALSAIDNTLLLTKDFVLQKLGPSALERVNEYRVCAWLGQQEDHHRIVLYQCESKLTPWTRRCMRQADCLLIVGLASNEANVGQLEKEIDNFAIRAQKELVLLHKMDGSRPKNTVKWLNLRSWCTSHHHIRCPDSIFNTGNNERLLKSMQEQLNRDKVDKMTDFSRLARFLTGTSIGVVLGGGGARGAAHVGMIKAMIEANIPIDMIGGTSIGSFMGALWAEENDFDKFCNRAREWSKKMTSYYRQILDLTYPITSMFTGHAFNKTIEEVFCNRQIEDLWIPYFCVTTDISSSKMRIHMNGQLWRYVRSSMTYCNLFPPMCDPFDGHLLVDGCYVNNVPGSLWRYVRSSMSLSGYLPPLSDPIDGHLLLDGGYVNNLPADVMHRMGVNTVLAIDVGSQDDDNFTNYGDELSGWWLLWKKWNHWAKPVKVPDLTEIQSRLAYVSCQRGLEIVKNSEYCNYMRPPIDKYRTLQFGSFDEIREVGYNYGKILFDTWMKHAGSIEKFIYRKRKQIMNQILTNEAKENSPLFELNGTIPMNRQKSLNRYQFEDLSQFVKTPVKRSSNEHRRSYKDKESKQQEDTDDASLVKKTLEFNTLDETVKKQKSKSVQIDEPDDLYANLMGLKKYLQTEDDEDDDEEDENDELEDYDDEIDDDELQRAINSHLKSIEASSKSDKPKSKERIVSTVNKKEQRSQARESKLARQHSANNRFFSQNKE